MDGVLDRVDKVTQFTDFYMEVVLHAPAGTDENKAERLLTKSKDVCLVTNSLTGTCHLNTTIVIDD